MGVLAAAWTNDSCNECFAQDENLSVTDRIKMLIEEAVKEGFEQGREEVRKAFEQRMKNAARETSRAGYSNEKIARTLGFDQATVEAWLAEQRP